MTELEIIEHVYRTRLALFMALGRQFRLATDIIEELMQEAFASAIRSRKKIKVKTEAGIRGYIVRSFRNKCIDHLRNAANAGIGYSESSESLLSADFAMADTTADPLHELLLREEMRLRETALSLLLPEKYKEPVRLYLEGKKPKEIADILKKNGSTTRNLIQRGLKKFETIMMKLDPLRKET